MELILVRHGEGYHTLDIPLSLYLENPPLTITGENQTKKLTNILNIKPTDLIITSPTLRTIETSLILNNNATKNLFVHPFIGPRIFPEPSKKNTLPCDYLLSIRFIEKFYNNLLIPKGIDSVYWQSGVINVLSSSYYIDILSYFINWVKSLKFNRVIIISHDGTITWIRERTTRKLLTRSDFLSEASFITIEI
ncbi:histidine phosphatase family protein [Cytobacillus purgationiresistens]|uniref:Histidine phosphatase family protein n=1 Tax=Cytobacillus purgationiresistens TaxID=863449 RepID=A0ABU0AQ93_9BACI|nr:histidine phosphatase family protein [Cytobacillus purgationiresistens]MDQ0273385.1 hypothetical protein [Cytobacillus purgationiresistens]